MSDSDSDAPEEPPTRNEILDMVNEDEKQHGTPEGDPEPAKLLTAEELAQIRAHIGNPPTDDSVDNILRFTSEKFSSPECDHFRAAMQIHHEQSPSGSLAGSAPPRWLVDEHCPLVEPLCGQEFEAQLTVISDSENVVTVSHNLSLSVTADVALKEVFGVLTDKSKLPNGINDLSCIFKHPTQNQYFYGDAKLREFQYIYETCQHFNQTHGKTDAKPVVQLHYVEHPHRSSSAAAAPQFPYHGTVDVSSSSTHETTISHWDKAMDTPLKFTVTLDRIVINRKNGELKHLHQSGTCKLSLRAMLRHGGTVLTEDANGFESTWQEAVVQQCSEPDSQLVMLQAREPIEVEFTNTLISNLPKETRLQLAVCASSDSVSGQVLPTPLSSGKNEKIIAWANLNVFQFDGYMAEDDTVVKMWAGQKPVPTCSSPARGNSSSVTISWPKYEQGSIKFDDGEPPARKFEEMEAETQAYDFEIATYIKSSKEWQSWCTRYTQLDGGESSEEEKMVGYLSKLGDLDPLYDMPLIEQKMLWRNRRLIVNIPHVLPKLLRSVDWGQPAAVYEIHTLLTGGSIDYYACHDDEFESTCNQNMFIKVTAPLEYAEYTGIRKLVVLELLQYGYADQVVRSYAVNQLEKFSDQLLLACFPQLMSALNYEAHHYSAMSRFLLKRALQSPYSVGQALFWNLRQNLDDPHRNERSQLLLEELLGRLSPAFKTELLRQHLLVCSLCRIHQQVLETHRPDERGVLRKALREAEFPVCTLPMDARIELQDLVIEKCNIEHSSHFKPLRLVFARHNEGNYTLLFSRKFEPNHHTTYALTILSAMDMIWKQEEAMDNNLTLYYHAELGCCCTLTELPAAATSVYDITREFGDAKAAYFKEPLLHWLKEKHPISVKDPANAQYWKQVGKNRKKKNSPDPDLPAFVDNFAQSLAGYSAATYVMGCGNRCNENISVKEDGSVFHTNFGSFMGNFMNKFGYKRETTPFTLTPMYPFVLGLAKLKTNTDGTFKPSKKVRPGWDKYTLLMKRAVNSLAKNSDVLQCLFLLLTHATREFERRADFGFLRHVLWLPSSVSGSADRWLSGKMEALVEQKIVEAYNNKRAMLTDYIHLMAFSGPEDFEG